MLKRLLIVCVVLSCFSTPGWSGINPDSFTLSPMVGGHVFEGNQSLENSSLVGFGLGYNLTNRAALEAVYTQTDADAEDASTTDSKIRTYRLDALYHFMPENNLVPYLAVGFGGINTNPEGAKAKERFMANYGFGIKYFIDQWVAFRADVRHLLEFPEPDNNLLYTAGVMIQLGGSKPAPQPVDVPPPAAEPKPAAVPLDSDGDGVTDAEDQCANTPQGAPVNAIGCPIDSDGDGVADYLDNCPNTPQGASVDSVGCPLDSDGDGVFDHLDNCPKTPQGVSIDVKGCPTKLTLRINFGLDSNAIGEQFLGEIAKAASCINEFPGNIVNIDGHTDDQGPAEYNQRLSERRATAVVKALVDKFDIPASRLSARGFGESQPIADNSTKEGRFENRRVEVACGATE